MPELLRQLRREGVDFLDRTPHAVVAERDLAVQAPGVAELEAVPLRAVGLDLADVVQQRARDRHVAVDPRKRRADRAHSLRDAETVLQQPVTIGLVVVLCSRRHPVRG